MSRRVDRYFSQRRRYQHGAGMPHAGFGYAVPARWYEPSGGVEGTIFPVIPPGDAELLRELERKAAKRAEIDAIQLPLRLRTQITRRHARYEHTAELRRAASPARSWCRWPR